MSYFTELGSAVLAQYAYTEILNQGQQKHSETFYISKNFQDTSATWAVMHVNYFHVN